MTKFIQTVLKVFLLGMILGCHPYNKGAILKLAEECMEICPDSAYQMLKNLNGFEFDSDYQFAKYALLWTQAQHKCHCPLENDSLINVAVGYFTQHNKIHYAAKAYLYKGLVHKQRKEVEQAAAAFAQCELWFEGVEDDQYKALLYNHYGALMLGEENYEDALRYLKRSYHFKLRGDSIHYIMSACGAIANVFSKLGQSDSAKLYYEQGLQYKGKVSISKYCLFKQNYANFLRKNKEYEKAEQMLLECEQHITDRRKYSVYSSLASLYYETEEYDKALGYAERVLESGDSVMQRGGFLNLYRIHKQLGHVSKSLYFHDLYREYDNDITLRLKTTKVAAISHVVRENALQVANQRGRKAQWRLTVGLLVVMLASSTMYLYIKRRHKRQQQILHNQLAEDKREIRDMSLVQNEKDREIGQLHYQIERKREQMRNLEQRQKERLEREKEKVKEKKNEIDELKESKVSIKREKRELERELSASLKEQRVLQAVADEAMHEQRIKAWITNYMRAHLTEDDCKKNVALLMQLKYGTLYVGNPIPYEQIVPMIVTMLDEEHQGMRQRIDTLTNNTTKQVMCYLMVLGLDDEEMMYRATAKKLDTIKKYFKECQDIVDEELMEGVESD